jgi:uncharacterized membrane protein
VGEVSVSPNSAQDCVKQRHQHKAAWGAMLAGAALSIYGWTRKSASGAALGVAGGAVALKAATAGPIADLVGNDATLCRSVVIMRRASDIYAFWKDLSKAPQWLDHVESAVPIDNRITSWTCRHPGARILEWRTETTEDIPNELIAWRTLPRVGSPFGASGRVEFKDFGNNRGTTVILTVCARMRSGLIYSAAPTSVGLDAQYEIGESLRRFKMLMEAGEIATIKGQSQGPRGLKGKLKETLLREERQIA